MKFLPKGPLTLRSRLLLLFGCSVLAVWAAASVIAYYEIREEIDDILDAQQILFARYLANSNLDVPGVSPGDQGILALAVFDSDGNVVLNKGLYGLLDPKNQKAYPLSEAKPKLHAQNRWRMLWLELPKERFGGSWVLAVGQHVDYREELVIEALEEQMVPWLVLFLLLLYTVLWMTKREFQPLSEVAKALEKRRPEDATPLASARLPGEIRPFVDALNALFAQVSEMLLRERRFTSDAAHELRSPLAGLGVQAEVARMAAADPGVLKHALSNLTRGIDRTTRLVEQLLALSRLDSLSGVDDAKDIDWTAMLRIILKDFSETAAQRRIDLKLENNDPSPTAKGHELLLSLLLRNLIDNALKHSPDGGTVRTTLSENDVWVEDDGPGVRNEYLPRLGERFFRLPGQDRTGTGLGLSIAKRIADLHGFHIVFSNRVEEGQEGQEGQRGLRVCLYLNTTNKK